MWSRADLKSRAKELLKRNYGKALAVSLILSFIQGASRGGSSSGGSGNSKIDPDQLGHFDNYGNFKLDPEFMKILIGLLAAGLAVFLIASIIGIAIQVFVKNPILVSGQRFFLLNRVSDDAQVGELGYAFKYGYKNIVLIMFFKDLYVWLWSLLFVIPGIIKGYEYRMIPYLLAENPNLSKEDAFRISKEMMDGEKWNAFVLDLSFIGWYLLAICTCGILAALYVNPYQNLTNAELYAALKSKSSNPNIYQNNQAYGQNYNQNYGQNYNQTYGQNYGQNQYTDQNYTQPYGQDSYQNTNNDQWNNQ